MALKIKSIKRDRAKEDEGDWKDVPDWPGVRIKARGINYKPYQMAREMLVQKLMRTLGRFPSTTEMEPMLGKLVATHLLLGWDGIVDGPEIPEAPKEAREAAIAAQAPIEWTPEVGLQYLTDRDYSELEQRVILVATLVGDRDAEFTASAVKN